MQASHYPHLFLLHLDFELHEPVHSLLKNNMTNIWKIHSPLQTPSYLQHANTTVTSSPAVSQLLIQKSSIWLYKQAICIQVNPPTHFESQGFLSGYLQSSNRSQPKSKSKLQLCICSIYRERER
nr:hypothetical protein Iba_chr08aCG1410 [Ipomoea batatas]